MRSETGGPAKTVRLFCLFCTKITPATAILLFFPRKGAMLCQSLFAVNAKNF